MCHRWKEPKSALNLESKARLLGTMKKWLQHVIDLRMCAKDGNGLCCLIHRQVCAKPLPGGDSKQFIEQYF